MRLELVRYLLQNHNPAAARAELLVAEGNADNDSAVDLELGRLFEQVGDRPDALAAYLKAVEANPEDPEPLTAAGRQAYLMGDFAIAKRLLDRAAHAPHPREHTALADSEAADLLKNSERILQIFPSPKLPSEQRVARLLALKTVAERRLRACAGTPAGLPSQLGQINASWLANGSSMTSAALRKDQSRQDELLQLIYATEAQADAAACGPADGDHALLVLLSRNPKAVER